MLQQLFYWWRYWRDNIPWDSGVTPPELIAVVEQENLPPGRAIDLGCGTGTNSVYLAKHGWTVVGVDYIARPIKEAKLKAAKAGVARTTRFVTADVLQLSETHFGGPFDLGLDIGCCHSLARSAHNPYARNLGRMLRSGGTFLLYMFRPTAGRRLGLEPHDVEALFAPDFALLWSTCGEDLVAGSDSAWYRFRRV